jgi:hypothetical protein
LTGAKQPAARAQSWKVAPVIERLAEADGNRTRLTQVLGHVGVEDRAAHQDGYASAADPMQPT